MDEHKDTRSVAELMSELATETSTLVRQEVALAKAEANEKVSQLTGGIKSLVVGGAMLIVSLFYVLDAVVYGLAQLLPEGYRLWLAALIVGVVLGIVGLMMLKKGEKSVEPRNLAPHRTTHSVKQDADMVKGHSQ